MHVFGGQDWPQQSTGHLQKSTTLVRQSSIPGGARNNPARKLNVQVAIANPSTMGPYKTKGAVNTVHSATAATIEVLTYPVYKRGQIVAPMP
jgi:hypothetical protein